MPILNFAGIDENEDTREQLAELTKLLNYLLNGQIDFKNVRARSIKADNIEAGTLTANEIAANTITADKMDVDELSAISANLGTIIAGIIRGIQIFGSYIATADGTFPRSEMNVAENFFAALYSADTWLKVIPFIGPALQYQEGSYQASISMLGGVLNITSGNRLRLNGDSRTDLNTPDLRINGNSTYTGTVSTGTNTLTFENGLLIAIS